MHLVYTTFISLNFCSIHLILGGGFLNIAKNQINADLFIEFTGSDIGYTSPYTWDIIGKNLFIMGIEGLVFLLLNLLWEKMFDQKIPNSSNGNGEGVLVVKSVSKIFKKIRSSFKAVDNISLKVERGECFGLIGLNGLLGS